eukprot:1144908-Pelagomonas_calceolata.AAC.14
MHVSLPRAAANLSPLCPFAIPFCLTEAQPDQPGYQAAGLVSIPIGIPSCLVRGTAERTEQSLAPTEDGAQAVRYGALKGGQRPSQQKET